MEKHLFIGEKYSDKSSKLIEEYKKLISKGIMSNKILCIVPSRYQALKWNEKIDIDISSEVNIRSFFGFVQKELNLFWPLVDICKNSTEKPTFMTFEATQAIMISIVRKRREEGFFSFVHASDDRIAIELINNLSKAAINGVNKDEIKDKFKLGINGSKKEYLELLDECQNAYDIFINECIKRKTLDYSLSVDFYFKYLFCNKDYLKSFSNRFSYIFIDYFEESFSVLVDFIKIASKEIKGLYISYSDDGAITSYYGADKVKNEKFINEIKNDKNSKIIESKRIRKKDDCLEIFRKKISNGFVSLDKTYDKFHCVEKNEINNFRSGMLESVSNRIKTLIIKGYKESDIAVISPECDITTHSTLEHLTGFEIENHVRTKRKIDNPLVKSLIVLSTMTKKKFGVSPGFNDIAYVLSKFLQIDIIRSSVIAQEIISKKPYKLPDIKNIEIAKRVGFYNMEKYDYLRQWAMNNIDSNENYGEFLKKIYLEVMTLMEIDKDYLKEALGLIESSFSFNEIMDKYIDFDYFNKFGPDSLFIEMIMNGAKAAEQMEDLEKKIKSENIIMITPSNYILERIKRKVHIWMDINTDAWSPKIQKDLSNSYLLFESWDSKRQFTLDDEMDIRTGNLQTIISGLINGCDEKIITFESIYNSGGFEEVSLLSQTLYEISKRGKNVL